MQPHEKGAEVEKSLAAEMKKKCKALSHAAMTKVFYGPASRQVTREEVQENISKYGKLPLNEVEKALQINKTNITRARGGHSKREKLYRRLTQEEREARRREMANR